MTDFVLLLSVGDRARRANDGREFEVLGKHRKANYLRVRLLDAIDLKDSIDYLGSSEIVPIDEPLAVAADTLRKSANRADVARSELNAALMAVAESAQETYPNANTVAESELRRIMSRRFSEESQDDDEPRHQCEGTSPTPPEVLSGRYGPMIVTLTPLTIEIREKGRRKSFALPYGVAYQQAVALTVTEGKRPSHVKRGLLGRGS